MRCPVHLAWEASEFPAAQRAEVYRVRGVAVSEITYEIWRRAANFDERGVPGMSVSYRAREAGQFAAMKYCRIYQQEEDETGQIVEEDWPEDLPVLEGE